VRPALALLAVTLLGATAGRAQDEPARHGFWADVQFGYGQLEKSSDQEPQTQHDVFALQFGLGGWLHHRLRLGGEIGGWLIEAFSTTDPSKGESVSQLRVVAQFYPSRHGFFLKGAVGQAVYTNEHPLQFDSRGWGGTIGVGYDLRLGRNFSLTPTASYNAGTLGDVRNLVTTVRNRRYRVADIAIALTYR
jgi:hypothetical protein